jgi:Fe-S cluster biogenesis protein NfuA
MPIMLRGLRSFPIPRKGVPLDNHLLKKRVADALAQHVGPALDMDGTQLEVLDVDDGIARLRLSGVCGTCPSSIMLVVHGIETELRKHVPEIWSIEAVP